MNSTYLDNILRGLQTPQGAGMIAVIVILTLGFLWLNRSAKRSAAAKAEIAAKAEVHPLS